MEKVTRTTNNGDPYMARFNKQVNSTEMMVDSKAKNNALKEQQWQSLYRGVYSDPFTSGRAAIKISSTLNKYGYNHFVPTSTRQLYNVGLPTGGGKDPLSPLIPPRKYSMSG